MLPNRTFILKLVFEGLLSLKTLILIFDFEDRRFYLEFSVRAYFSLSFDPFSIMTEVLEIYVSYYNYFDLRLNLFCKMTLILGWGILD